MTRQFALAADEYESVIKIEPDQPSVRIESAVFVERGGGDDAVVAGESADVCDDGACGAMRRAG